MINERKLETKVDRFKKIVNELADLYEKKNHNYGDSFGKLYEDLGPIAGLVPLHNKLDRLTNLIKGDSNHFESIEDNFRDLANYAIMNLIEFENMNKKDEPENWWDCTGWNEFRKKELNKEDMDKADSKVLADLIQDSIKKEYENRVDKEIDRFIDSLFDLEEDAEYSDEH